MSHLREVISDFVKGDSYQLPRTVNIEDILPDTLDKAWFTVKRRLTDTDADAMIFKEITPALTADGQIDIVGGTGVDAHMFFLLAAADTDLLSPTVLYYYDIKGLSSGGAAKVLESGRINSAASVTTTGS